MLCNALLADQQLTCPSSLDPSFSDVPTLTGMLKVRPRPKGTVLCAAGWSGAAAVAARYAQLRCEKAATGHRDGAAASYATYRQQSWEPAASDDAQGRHDALQREYQLSHAPCQQISAELAASDARTESTVCLILYP